MFMKWVPYIFLIGFILSIFFQTAFMVNLVLLLAAISFYLAGFFEEKGTRGFYNAMRSGEILRDKYLSQCGPIQAALIFALYPLEVAFLVSFFVEVISF